MNRLEQARAAVSRFTTEIRHGGSRTLLRVLLRGDEGMPSLCAIEAAILEVWPASRAREMVWLTGAAKPDTLHIQAFARGGELLAEATYVFAQFDA